MSTNHPQPDQADSNYGEIATIKTDQAEREVDDLLARMSSEYYAEVDSNIISAAMRKELLVWHNTALAQSRREGEVEGAQKLINIFHKNKCLSDVQHADMSTTVSSWAMKERLCAREWKRKDE